MADVKVVENPTVLSFDLHVPPMEELCGVIEAALKENFYLAKVEVVDCPDLTKDPFYLASPGLCGDTRLVDLGGPPYLIPLVQRDKIYNLADIPHLANVKNPVLIIGAGAGPWFHLGTNCEMMANLGFQNDHNDPTNVVVCNATRLATIKKPDENMLHTLPEKETRCALLANLLVCRGQMGPVLRIECSQRKGSTNFVTCMRQALRNHYGDKPIGLGGTFLMGEGKAKLHIMPDFSPCPLNSDEDVERWLHFYNAKAPLVALSTFVSHDPGLDLRVEHSHCFSLHGEGGHYHEDVTPDIVKYLGYFVPAEKIVRVDPPQVTHKIGRD